MKVQTALLARYTEVEQQGGLLNVTGGGLDVFGLSQLPAEYPVSFVLQLTFDEAEADQEHQLSVTVLASDLQPIGQRVVVPFTPTFGELHAEGWRGVFSVAGSIELRVENSDHTAFRSMSTAGWRGTFRSKSCVPTERSRRSAQGRARARGRGRHAVNPPSTRSS